MRTNASTSSATSPACTKCGNKPCFIDHWGRFAQLCKSCEKARLDEIERIYAHHEQHPEDCCCDTFLTRACCMAAIHGDEWRVNAIQDGQRFCFFIRAKDKKEAMQVGTEACQDNGEECISVSKKA